MKPMGKIPVGWMAYAPIGSQVPGTRFIAFKVPLRETFVDKLKPEDRFTVPILLERVPELGLIIDLTQTVRYYNKNEVLDRGTDYVKIPIPGQVVPSQQYVDRFFEVVDYYLDTHKADDSLIGVHCTHGVNRTGYMLCRYLIQRLGYSFEDAIEAVGTSRGHPIERSHYLTSLREHRETTLKKSTRGDLEEGKSKMSKKSLIKPTKKPSEPRATLPGKERFARREEGYPPREDHRGRSPHRAGPYGDFGGERAMVGREPPHHMRGRTPPPHMRGRTPPPHSRGRTPPPPRGRTPPYMNPSSMPPPHQSYPPHGRSPPRRSPPPHHMRGRSPPPPQHHMRGRSPPPSRGRTPPHMRGRSPPPPHYFPHQEPGMGRPPVRGRSPPPHPGHMRDRTPPPYHGRGRTPPPMRGHSPPPAPRDIVPHSPGNFSRRESASITRRSPPRGREVPSVHEVPRSDRFPPGRRTPPPVSRHEPPPMRAHSPPTVRRDPPSQSRVPPEDYYRGEYRAGPSAEPSRDYSASSKYQSRQQPYSGETGHYNNYFQDYYHGNQHRERSRSPQRREEAAFYPDRRKDVSPQRDLKRRRKSPVPSREKSARSPPPRYGNGRDLGGPPDRREGHSGEEWTRLQQDYGPDCREILNERRSMRDPYQDAEYEDRKRSLAERLPPKNVDLRESLEEEKRRKQGYAEPYPGGDYERKRAKRDFPEYEGSRSEVRGGYEQQASHYDHHPEGQVEGGDYGGRPFGGRGGGGGGMRGGKRVFDRLARGRRGSFRN